MFPKDGFSCSAVDFSDWLGLCWLKGAETPVQGICACVWDVLASFLWQHGKDAAVLQQPGHDFKHCHHFLHVPNISFSCLKIWDRKNRTCDDYLSFLPTGTLGECSSIEHGNQLIVTFGLVSSANSHVTHGTTSVQELQANWRSTAALLTLTHFKTSTCWSLTRTPEGNFMVWWNRSESNKRMNKSLQDEN